MAGAKRSAAGGLDGWAWNEVKALPLPWFSGLAILLNMIELSGDLPQGLSDAYIAMIPKADGDSTPLGQRPPQLVASMVGVDGETGVFDTEGTDVEVPLCPQW